MKIAESKYFSNVKKIITINEGDFYVFDDYVVGEIKQGVVFNWDCAEEVIEEVYNYFGNKNIKVSYVSNRIHSYSLYPQDWLKFFNGSNTLNCISVVTNERIGLSNLILEKLFIKTKVQKFTSLDNAIAWAKQQTIKEKNKLIA
ncbi:hypothetical protein ULMS_18730 [Patiriisocius marinistellae]|uniref:STAS/SEC14 domain-containing protein n=1 Tax=Patiriisocius marinistellae TaxID=2494560 RepID=A0A5J4G1M8_9FLAO|nr:hypothetical protein [Patiriisocius marinistellae]GEQ86365.1 hypothetical protein ULMS_18730 [Patiriisocius marinistellae]